MCNDFVDARPNETKTIKYLDDTVDVYGDGWRDVVVSLLGFLSDDDVRVWTRVFGIEDDVFEEGEEDEEDA